MDLGLKGKRAIVTGAARGIGFATAEVLLEEGARVLLNDLDPQTLNQAMERLRGLPVTGVAADVSAAADVQRLFAEADKAMGGVDVLINNAGILGPAVPLPDITEELWERMIRVNLISVHLCSREAVKRMSAGGGGVILNAASWAALLPTCGRAVYGATKAAVLNLTRTMAAEFAPLGIRVNAYVPGVIATDMTAPLIEKASAEILEQIALQRFGEPGEVAAPLVFLASEKAAYITGAVLEISGGKLAVQRPRAAWPQEQGKPTQSRW
jgi:NAD(P)-dependent dehydrogenase (short-subunit alcohol dehydrogenase family)